MQRWFLHELEVTDLDTFKIYNFALPSLRRRIGLLGFLHKCVLEQCHPYLLIAFPMQVFPDHFQIFHNRTLRTFLDEVISHRPLYFRSVYGYTLIYNRLPQSLVNSPSVKTFQSRLTQIARYGAENGDSQWRHAFADDADVLEHCHGH